jgi:hypothetical protein
VIRVYPAEVGRAAWDSVAHALAQRDDTRAWRINNRAPSTLAEHQVDSLLDGEPAPAPDPQRTDSAA